MIFFAVVSSGEEGHFVASLVGSGKFGLDPGRGPFFFTMSECESGWTGVTMVQIRGEGSVWETACVCQW